MVKHQAKSSALYPVILCGKRKGKLAFFFNKMLNPFRESTVAGAWMRRKIKGMERAACEKAALPLASLSTNEG